MLLLIVTTLFFSCAADPSKPDYMGDKSGEIWRCRLDIPNSCGLIHKGTSTVTDTLVRGKHLYASHNDGVILKCNWYGKSRCKEFHRSGTFVNSLAASDGFLYAAVDDNNMMRCKLNVPRSCTVAHTFELPVRGLYNYGNHIYVAIPGYLYKCSKGAQVDCYQVQKSSSMPKAIAAWGKTIINLSWTRHVWSHNLTSTMSVFVNGPLYHDMAIYKGKMYLVHSSGISTCRWDEASSCTNWTRHEDTRSISFVYRTHPAAPVSWSQGLCSRGAGEPPVAFKYMESYRALLEVNVVDGLLHDARGRVDTRRADVGQSGRAAIFAMGADGQLLLSTAHSSGLVHVTGLFAGLPVSGAGEMHVRDGVILKMVACAEQYRADSELNRQVIHELYSRGYTRAIQLEECPYTCDRD